VKRLAATAALLFVAFSLPSCEAVGLRDRPPPRPAAESPLKLRLEQIATDFYLWMLAASEYRLAGPVAWEQDGLIETRILE